MKNTLGVIPARMASSRFPGKPLKKILDIPMLAHCYERAAIADVCETLVIATPDQEILNWANFYDIPVVQTSYIHQRATDRAKETLDILTKQGNSYENILLLQGDEPQILPGDIKSLKQAFSGKKYEAVNLIFPIFEDDLKDQNVVKAVLNKNLEIKFFSRSYIPYQASTGFRQLGMIGFSHDALIHYASLAPTPMEETESIDMMRFLENDFSIQGVLSSSPIIGVDKPEDILKVEKMMVDDHYVHLYKEKYL
jgi:3-deoxy-manno-octulosonate cytidylyltransferase (CMP-KDO synthetase)